MIGSGRSLFHDALKTVWHNKRYMLIPFKYFMAAFVALCAMIIVSIIVAMPFYLVWPSKSGIIGKTATYIFSPFIPFLYFGLTAYILAVVRNQSMTVWQAISKGWRSLLAAWWLIVVGLVIVVLKEASVAMTMANLLWSVTTVLATIIFAFLPFLVVDGSSRLFQTLSMSLNYFKRGWKPWLSILFLSTMYQLVILFVSAILAFPSILFLFSPRSMPPSPAVLLVMLAILLIVFLMWIVVAIIVGLSWNLALARLYLELREEKH